MKFRWSMPSQMQRLWFIHTISDLPELLHIGVDLKIQGYNSPCEVRTAFEATIKRHEAFALRFALGPSSPLCQLADAPEAHWDVVDASGCAGVSDEESLARMAAQVHRRTIDLEHGPIICATLFRLGSTRSMLSITSHQLIADAHTFRIVIEDLLDEWRKLRGEAMRARRSSPGFTQVLQQYEGTNTRAAENSRWNEEVVALDSAPTDTPHSIRNGVGDEHTFLLGKDCVRRLRHVCGQCGVTLFTGLLAGFAMMSSEAGFALRSDIGVIVSNRELRKFGRTAGSFVQMVQLSLEVERCTDILSMLCHTDLVLREARTRARLGSWIPSPKPCRIMVSMVRDSGVCLFPPAGISIRSQRRRRVQAECELHLFIHDLGSDVEMVMNYDIDVLSLETVLAWGTRYVEILDNLSWQRLPLKHKRSGCEPDAAALTSIHPAESRLHHVGLAVWELDIALHRLATRQVRLHGDTVIDHDIGVAMALAGPIAGVELELVAPLRQEAPCVGALTRDGEGGYHCCWQVADALRVQEYLSGCRVECTPVIPEASSPLFPGGRVSFVLVSGFGLVEWLSLSEQPGASVVDGPTPPLRIYIESSDFQNAARFLEAMGYSSERNPRCWQAPNQGHFFMLLPSRRGADGITHIANADASPDDSVGKVPMVTKWWSRVQLCRLRANAVATRDQSG